MISYPSASRFIRASVLALSAFAGAFCVAAPEKVADPIIELPKVIVTDARDLPQPESWRYGEIHGFEILTNASARRTQQLITDFEMFRTALGLVWPTPNRPATPISLILCGEGGKFDAFVPAGKTRADMATASLFFKDREQTAIVVDLQATTLNIAGSDMTDDMTTGTDSTQFSVEHNKVLYREYVRYLLSRSDAALPAWFEEGLAQIIMAMKIDPKQIVLGRLEEGNTVSTQAATTKGLNAVATADSADEGGTVDSFAGAPAEDRDFNNALRHSALVPMAKFFAVAHDSPEALNPLGNNHWAKQAYAFVHMCLYGENGKYKKSFAAFLMRSAKEPVTEAMFKECFNMDYQKMLSTLRGYINFTNYAEQDFNAKKGFSLPTPTPVVLREATQSEVGRIKGEALMLAGHKDAAGTELNAPYIRGEHDDGRLIAALGLYEHTMGQDERARKLLEAAAKLKVERPRAYLELARFRYADALAKPAAPNGEFSIVQVNDITEPLRLARKQTPPMADVYSLMADAWAHSAQKPQRDDILLLFEGTRLFQGRLKLVYQTAAFAADAGMNDIATPLIDYGIKVSDAPGKALFEKLKASMPAKG